MAALLDSKRWDVLEQDEGAERRLVEELGIAPLVARVLVARGITDIAAAREFLAPSLVRDWADPLDIPGMAEAADRVERAVRSREKIAVFGDFDVDGMTSTCLLTQALRILGGDVDPYIPHRFGEGYGLTRAALGRVIEGSHPDLIITVDNGISAGDEVAWLVSQGIDVVVTDHHEPADLVPAGVPVTDPKLVEENYSRELAGAGVALKLVFELGRRFGQPDLWWDYTDLAALGTVSDMMLLTGENRSLVAHGIDCMRASRRPGIVALAMSAKCALTDITADNLPFTLIPRLNAAGRMGTTEAAFDLLISEDMAEATTLAAMLEETNTHRRETEGELANEAMRTLEGTYHGEQVIVVGGAGWHEGVKGIVASRIVNRYHVPAIVFSIEDGVARGSGRSVGSVDLFHAVEQCQDLLVRFGGHAGAVGVTCKEEDVDAFRARLVEVMAELPPEQFEDRGEVAALASLSELTRETIDSLDVLAPFGQGNKRPLLGIRSVFMRNRSRVGYDAKHLRFIATDGISQVPAIMFRAPDMSRAYAFDGIVDLVVDAVNETWQGRTNPKLMVQDICYHDEATLADATLLHLCERLCATSRLAVEPCVPAAGAAARLRAMDDRERRGALRQALGVGRAWQDVEGEEALISLFDAGETVLAAHAVARRVSELYIAESVLVREASAVVVVPRADVVATTRTLAGRMTPLGIAVREATAEMLEEDGFSWGEAEVLVATPERLEAMGEALADDGRLGFVCALEATGDALTRIAATLAPLRRRQLLPACCVACTEAEAHAVAGILKTSGAWQGVPAEAAHAEIEIGDLRGLRERETLLARLVTLGTRTVVYAGTWKQATDVCTWLMRTAPSVAGHIMPFDARLGADVRASIERSFGEGALRCLVVAAGVPDVVASDVVLFAFPRSISHLTHLAGCLRHGGTLHLLFGEREAREVEERLQVVAPERAELVTLYRTLVAVGKSAATRNTFSLDQTLLCSSARTIDATTRLTENTVAMGVSVFEELGFLHVSRVGHARTVEMVEGPRKVELERSATYLEGRTRLEDFRAFAGWLLTAGGSTVSDVLASLL